LRVARELITFLLLG